jgi:hypothetical protein
MSPASASPVHHQTIKQSNNQPITMKLNYLAVAASLGLTAVAQPTGTCATPSKPDTFGLVAIRSGDAVQYAGFNAALRSIFAGLPSQNATCDGTDDGYATFYLKDGALFLYGPNEQQLYVDRSGMGMLQPMLDLMTYEHC